MLKEALEKNAKLEAKIEELTKKLEKYEKEDQEEKIPESVLLTAQHLIEKKRKQEDEDLLNSKELNLAAEALIKYYQKYLAR